MVKRDTLRDLLHKLRAKTQLQTSHSPMGNRPDLSRQTFYLKKGLGLERRILKGDYREEG